MRRFFRSWGLLILLAGNASALTIDLDYTYDNGYFADPGNAAAKAALEQAAADLSAALPLSLAEATNTYTGTSGKATVNLKWNLLTKDPSDLSVNEVISTFTIPEGKFRIYVGATTNLPGAGDTIGLGSPVSKQYTIEPLSSTATDAQYENALQNAISFSNAGMSRGSGPRQTITDSFVDFGAPANNVNLLFGPVAGFLTFDTAATWHFDHTTAVGAGEYDFYTVMLHEMMHCLGLGNSSTWTAKVSGMDWSGAHVITLVGSGTGLIHDFYNKGMMNQTVDGDHIASGTMSTTVVGGVAQEAVMTSSLTTGQRRNLTVLDVAFLQDIGYDAFAALPTPTPEPTVKVPTPTPTPEVPPADPVVSGPKKIKTSTAKIKISGFLTTPGAHVEFAVGKTGSFKKAKGAGKWSFVAKLVPGKNLIQIVTVSATGQKSAVKKITVTRN